jgi:hypothetical protein
MKSATLTEPALRPSRMTVFRPCVCLLALTTAALAVSACGGSNPRARPVDTAALTSASLPRCRVATARAKRALSRIHADIARIRRAKTHAQTSAATDRFINNFEHSTLSPVTKSRLIDLAVSAGNGKCADLLPGPRADAHQASARDARLPLRSRA